MTPETQISTDTLFDGNITCRQNIDGYRYSIDSILLAHFIHPKNNDSILELGAGCGIIMLILLYRWRWIVKNVTGIEVQNPLASLATDNIRENNLQHLAKVINGDIKNIQSLVAAESYQIVISNPPFYLANSGRKNINQEATHARHQVLACLHDFFAAASSAVINRGSVYFIYPAELIGDFIPLARKHKLEVKKIQFVYSYPHSSKPAKLALIQCVKNGGVQVEIMAPFYIYKEKNGPYSAAMKKMYAVNPI